MARGQGESCYRPRDFLKFSFKSNLNHDIPLWNNFLDGKLRSRNFLNGFSFRMKGCGGIRVGFILASASLRRQELLKRLIEDFEIIISDFDENQILFSGNPETYVMTLALSKARGVQNERNMDSYILGADTIVLLEGKILGKPADREEACSMLRALSGKSHEVYSGIALLMGSRSLKVTEIAKTTVKFCELSTEEIESYLDGNEWQDKAGAYGIQGFAGKFIERIEGDYYNVMGLPLNTLYKLLRLYNIIL